MEIERDTNNHKINRIGGFSISWLTIIIQILISLFFIPFFLKSVGDRQYGIYSFSNSVIAWLDTLLIAVGSAYYRFLTREKAKHGEYGEARACGAFFKIFIGITLLVLVFGTAFDLFLHLNVIKLNEYNSAEKNQICIIILLSILSTVVSCFLTVYKSYHYYKQKYILVYSIGLAQIVFQAILSIVFLKLGYGIVAVAAAHFGLSIMTSIVLAFLSKFYLKEKISLRSISPEDKTERRKLTIEILVFSSFVIINTVVDMLNRSLDKTILGFYNADSVATYQLAYTFPSYLISLTSVISIVFEKRMNDAYYSGKGVEEVNDLFLKISKMQTIITFLIVGGFIACGKEFVSLWVGGDRTQVYMITCILMVTYSITCCNRSAISGRRIQNMHKKAAFIYLGIALANIALSLILVNVFARENAIWACVIGTCSVYILGHWIIMQIYDKKAVKLNTIRFSFEFAKYLILAIALAEASFFFIDWVGGENVIVKFILKGLLFVVLYVLATFLIDRKAIKDSFKQLKNILRFKR